MHLQADFLLYNGELMGVERNIPPCHDALVIKDGVIAAISSREDLQESFRCKESIDLQGRAVLPGFLDSHVHFLMTGLNLLGLKIHDTLSSDDLLNRVQRAASTTPPGEMIFGSGYDESRYPDHTLPQIGDLDRITRDHPVWLSRVDCHSGLLNSLALKMVDLPEQLPGMETVDGKKTGLVKGQANSLTRSRILSALPKEMKKKALQQVTEAALAKGVTTIHALEGGVLSSQEDFLFLMDQERELPLDLVFYFQTTDVERVLQLGLPRIGGCVMLDGSIGSSTAALSTPFLHDGKNRGILYFTHEELVAFVEEAHRAKLQIATHVIGDRAIEQMLQVYQEVLPRYPRQDARHRLEHFELPTPGQIQQARELGLIISMQPAFDYFWGGKERLYHQRLGEREKEMNPLQAVYESGVILAGGSDSDVTPIHPMLGIHGAVNHSNPCSALTVSQALRLFTINSAYAAFLESDRGGLLEGKQAHITVLSHNPLTVEKEKIKEITVEMTIYRGTVVYVNESF